jgi:hypothetical protein
MGALFGFALGFASFSTVIPLFVSTMTDSAILIRSDPGDSCGRLAIYPAVHSSPGFPAGALQADGHVFYCPRALAILGLALCWFIPEIGPKIALFLTFMFLVWQGLGMDLPPLPRQAMIGKIIRAALGIVLRISIRNGKHARQCSRSDRWIDTGCL